MGIPLGQCEVEGFSDGETNVSIGESVRGSDVFVVQSTCAPVNDNLMELLLMIDAFKRASAAHITAVIPYYGYSRQDRKAKARDPISARLVADLITVAGADRVLTMDLHAAQIQGFFNIPTTDLLGANSLASYFMGKFSKQERQILTVVSPDLGSVPRSRKFAEKIDAPLAIIDKRRPKANVSEVMNIIGDVRGRIVLIVDDIIDTAGTLCQAARALMEVGGAAAVYAGATHGVLSGPAIERIEKSPIQQVVLLDTIPLCDRCKIPKIIQLSTAHIFGEAISRIFEDKPVSPMFT
jgi:ribose-phosphate pyrophosphokinase